MKNPYEILGVSPSASDDDIKAAYRNLARKYHPDQYDNNPLSDLAQEKMKEINDAYDTIIRERQSRSGGGSTAGYADVRALLAQRRYGQAEELLDGVPMGARNAEWHYLKGQVLYHKGWIEEANRHFSTASNMDPQNAEYRSAVQRSSYQRSGGYTQNAPNGCTFSACDVCGSLICADCCCECMGGDCISCC